jgi:ribosomal-protein-serine acetyltransferase
MTEADDIGIQPYAADDAQAVCEAVQESAAQLRPWMPWAHAAYSIADSQTWANAATAWFADRKAYEFKIVTRDGRYLGGCGLNQLDVLNRRANLGYWVRSSATRHGVASRAVALLRDWAIEHTDLHRLEILVAAGNAASLAVADRCGAVREGTLRDRLLLNGVYHDSVMFSLLLPARS